MRIFFFSLLTLAAAPLFAENWPQWRGPRLDGTSLDQGFPMRVDEKSLTWKTELPGEGHASPIVWEDRLFIAASDAETEERLLLAIDRGTG